MNTTTIGGEFDINLHCFSGSYDTNFLNNGYLYSSGRAALYHILLCMKANMKHIRFLMLPDYLCSSIIEIALKADFELIFYSLSASLKIDQAKFSSAYRKDCAILLINYFGLVSLTDQIKFLREIDENICIIEDNVQSFFSMLEKTESNFSFTSFRKTLPLPDGGWVKSDYEMFLPTSENTFVQYKVAGGILKGFRDFNCIDDSLYLNLLEAGEVQIDDNLNSKISTIAPNLLSRIDLHRVAVLRKRNANYLLAGLKSIGIEPLVPLFEGCVPLFLPIYLEDRKKTRDAFFENHIYIPVHWPIHDQSLCLSKGEELANHELSLIIDQRYSLEDMDKILTVLKDSLYAPSTIR